MLFSKTSASSRDLTSGAGWQQQQVLVSQDCIVRGVAWCWVYNNNDCSASSSTRERMDSTRDMTSNCDVASCGKCHTTRRASFIVVHVVVVKYS